MGLCWSCNNSSLFFSRTGMKIGIESPVWPYGRLVWQRRMLRSRAGTINLRNSSLNPALMKPTYVHAIFFWRDAVFIEQKHTNISPFSPCSTSDPCSSRIYGVQSPRRMPVPKWGYAKISVLWFKGTDTKHYSYIIQVNGELPEHLLCLCSFFLQRSTEQMRKVPTIVLSITYKGVKFIDAANKVSGYTHTHSAPLSVKVFRVMFYIKLDQVQIPCFLFQTSWDHVHEVLHSNTKRLLLNVRPASLCRLCSCLYFLTGSESAHIDIYLTLIKKDCERLP